MQDGQKPYSKKAGGLITNSMGMAGSSIVIAVTIKASLKTTRCTDTAHSHGRMVNNTSESGKKAQETDTVN